MGFSPQPYNFAPGKFRGEEGEGKIRKGGGKKDGRREDKDEKKRGERWRK